MNYKDQAIPPKFEGENIPDDFSIPPCGIEDMDKALFNLFNDRIHFTIEVDNEPKKVPVVFATGERFALTKRLLPIRDRNNALILPIVSIRRKNIDFTPGLGGMGTPIATRDQESYIIKKRLSKKDRKYQNIINKLRLKNQYNVSSRAGFLDKDFFPGNNAIPDRLATRRNDRNLSFLQDPNGKLLRDDIENNIFEIITIPYPEFILANYEVVFWTQYTIHMNQMLEALVSRFDGQEKGFQIETDSGYKFVAFFEGQFSSQDNFDNFSNEERVIKYTFNVKVPGFIIAPQQPGLPSPFRRTYSAPVIEFGIKQVSTQVVSDDQLGVKPNDVDKFILSDVNILNSRGDKTTQRDREGVKLLDIVRNPFTGENEASYSRVITRNQRSGETVASSQIVIDLETFNDTKSE